MASHQFIPGLNDGQDRTDTAVESNNLLGMSVQKETLVEQDAESPQNVQSKIKLASRRKKQVTNEQKVVPPKTFDVSKKESPL